MAENKLQVWNTGRLVPVQGWRTGFVAANSEFAFPVIIISFEQIDGKSIDYALPMTAALKLAEKIVEKAEMMTAIEPPHDS